MKKFWKILLKTLLIFLLVIVVIVGGYFAYVMISYHRIEDHLKLEIEKNGTAAAAAETGKEYKILSYNIGFGAYESDYDFFMDGGHQSWAWSKQRLMANLGQIARLIREENAEFLLIQEVDLDSTRSYHVNEADVLFNEVPGYSMTRAQNYDSPFLMYPFYQPHGASKSALMTGSVFSISEAERISLPVETSLYKLLDLDRCFSVQRIPLKDQAGKELVLINFHLSAYTSDGKISDEQAEILKNYMQAEYEKGNYVVAGGDFNKDLTGNATSDFGTLDNKDYSWAKPFPKEILNGSDVSLIVPYDPVLRIPSCRNPNEAWTHDNATQFVITVDGFLVSSNVEVKAAEVVDTDFAYSDHNPVRMIFELKE